MSKIEYGSLVIKSGGIQTLVEDWPGRVGYYKYGYAISGAADHYAHRMANLLVGNPITEATLEIAGGLFEAEFKHDTVIAVTGADMNPEINSKTISLWKSIRVNNGDVIKFNVSKGVGFRAYIAFAGGINVPVFFGSKSTCIWGAYGGFQGRALRKGDTLQIGKLQEKQLEKLEGRYIKPRFIPNYENTWKVRMLPGPTAAPDYVTEKGYEKIYSTIFKIDRNSDRSGYRLITPKEIFPQEWARKTGGVAGLHPSNLVDMGYPIPGGLNVTGDMIIILGPDGPCGGGFTIIGTVIYYDVWKVFQAIPAKDYIKFEYVDIDEAEKLRKEQDEIFKEEVVIGGV
jgi:biotin-dependent carboxylase-like uncharacterized protein